MSVNTKKLVLASLFTALTFIGTFAIKIQTPTFGYIHPGDCFVLLCAFFIGGPLGGLCAGAGSALSDLVSGYALWVPGTFVIKFLVALTAFHSFSALKRLFAPDITGNAGQSPVIKKYPAGLVMLSGLAGELVMVAGYFLYNIIMVSLAAGSFSTASVATAIAESAAEIPFNIVQGIFGIVLCTVLYPIIDRISRNSGRT